MTWKSYIRDKKIHISIYLFMIFLIMTLFISFRLNISLIISTGVIVIFFGSLIFLYDFQRKKCFYDQYISQLKLLDEKYLICELIKEPHFIEGQILYHSLYDINKAMLEKINELSISIEDFKEYIEMWIHEVKIPLSHLTLTVHNNHTKVSPQILEQVRRLENQVDQVLYYVRSQSAQKDYLVKENSLSQIVKNVIVKNKDYFIYHQLKINLKDLDYKVVTDSKWLEFILNQIINNSFQYSKNQPDSFIEISAIKKDNYIILSIYDNGIGIKKSDISRVFDKSFTGENGRIQKKSTGMGLYICQKLCQCLGHHIQITSSYGEYTKVEIVFSKNLYYEVLE